MPESPSNILAIARAHRGMMWLFLAKFGLDFASSTARLTFSEPLLVVYWLIYLGISAAVAYFVFRVCHETYGLLPAFICALLIAIPCLGTVCVLMLSGNTMDRLRKAGLKVGFFGATPAQLAELETLLKTTSPNEANPPDTSG